MSGSQKNSDDDQTKHNLGHQGVSFPTKVRLYKSLVVPGCQVWMLLTESEQWIQAYEINASLASPDLKEEKTNHFSPSLVTCLVGSRESLLATVKQKKLKWFGHVRHDTLTNMKAVDAAANRRKGERLK